MAGRRKTLGALALALPLGAALALAVRPERGVAVPVRPERGVVVPVRPERGVARELVPFRPERGVALAVPVRPERGVAREARDDESKGASSELPETESGLVVVATSDAEPWKRAAALRELGYLPDESPERAFVLARIGRTDLSAEVREAAALALGDLAARSPGEVACRVSHEAASNLAHERDGEVRAALVAAIQDTRDPAIVNELALRLDDPEAGVRAAAASALGTVAWTNRDAALAALGRRLDAERDEDARSEIAAAIEVMRREN